jgi:hypothetical protein
MVIYLFVYTQKCLNVQLLGNQKYLKSPLTQNDVVFCSLTAMSDNILQSCPFNDEDNSSIIDDARDFNCHPGEWPEGLKKSLFPEVYPKYAYRYDPKHFSASDRSFSGSSAEASEVCYSSSPAQNNGQNCKWKFSSRSDTVI